MKSFPYAGTQRIRNPEHQNWIESVIASAEFNWKQVAYETVERICANHYCPKMPPKREIKNSRAITRKVSNGI